MDEFKNVKRDKAMGKIDRPFNKKELETLNTNILIFIMSGLFELWSEKIQIMVPITKAYLKV